MKFNKIKTIKVITLLSILPLVLSSILIIGIVSYSNSKNIINTEIQEKMKHQLNENINLIQSKLNNHSAIALMLARNTESVGKIMKKQDFASITGKYIINNSDTLGAGVWYEPFKYDSKAKLFGPYSYKSEGKVVFTEDYETEEYNYPNQPWYKVGANSKKDIAWSKVFYDDMTKITMITAAAPFYDNNSNIMGVASADMDLTSIQNMIGSIKVGEKGKALLLDEDGTYLAYSDKSKVMNKKVIEDNNKSLAGVGKDIIKVKNGQGEYEENGQVYNIYYTQMPDTKWIIGLTIPQSELYSPLEALMVKMLILSILAAAIVVFVVYIFSKYITNSIMKVNDLSFAIAEGDLTHTMNIDSENEFGQMSTSLNKMTDNLKNLILKISESLEQVVATSEELTASADQTQLSAEQTAEAIQKIAEGSEEQVVITNDTQRVAGEIFKGMDQITNTVQTITESSLEAYNKAEEGNEVINSVINQMNIIYERVNMSSENVNVLGEKSSEIENIISLITAISEQTNLLALNAAIEAARAGEQGKGFAVVADEVRKLAEQSGGAAGQISKLVQEIQNEIKNAIKSMENGTSAIREGKGLVQNAGQTFEKILKNVDSVATQMQDASAVTEEINAGTQTMLEAVKQISEISKESAGNTQGVAAASEEQTALMKEVANAADTLTQMALELQKMMNSFKL